MTGVGSNIGAVGGARSGVKGIGGSRSRNSRSKKNRNFLRNDNGYEDEEEGNEFVDLEIVIPGMRRLSQSMNPLRNSGGIYSNIPLPSIGSRAAGKKLIN